MPTLREVRVSRLLTMRELARRAGVALSTVYLLEAGRTRPSLRVIRKLSAALGVAPEAVDEFRAVVELSDPSMEAHTPP